MTGSRIHSGDSSGAPNTDTTWPSGLEPVDDYDHDTFLDIAIGRRVTHTRSEEVAPATYAGSGNTE